MIISSVSEQAGAVSPSKVAFTPSSVQLAVLPVSGYRRFARLFSPRVEKSRWVSTDPDLSEEVDDTPVDTTFTCASKKATADERPALCANKQVAIGSTLGTAAISANEKHSRQAKRIARRRIESEYKTTVGSRTFGWANQQIPGHVRPF